jgi:hypothetical protein
VQKMIMMLSASVGMSFKIWVLFIAERQSAYTATSDGQR